MKKILITFAVILTCVFVWLFIRPTQETYIKEVTSHKVTEFNLSHAISAAIGIEDFDGDFIITDFSISNDNQGYISYLSIHALHASKEVYDQYAIQYLTENEKGKYIIHKAVLQQASIKGIDIDTISSTLKDLPMEDFSSIRSLGYYQTINISSKAESFLVDHDGIKRLESNTENELENVYVLYCIPKETNEYPVFYYISAK